MTRVLCLALLLIGCQEPEPPSATGRAYFQQGLEHAQGGRFHAAIAAYQQAARADARRAPSPLQSGQCLLFDRCPRPSRGCVPKGHSTQARLRGRVLSARLPLYIRQKKVRGRPMRRSTRHWRATLGTFSAYNALGLLHIRQGAYQEAADLYERALQVDSTHYELSVPSRPSSRQARQSARQRKPRLPRRFARTRPQAGAYAGLGALYVEEQSYEEAEDLLLRAVALRPFWARPHYDLGQVYMRLGEREKGREVLERFARLEEEEKMIKSFGIYALERGRGRAPPLRPRRALRPASPIRQGRGALPSRLLNSTRPLPRPM